MSFSERLAAWYTENQRDLPWRKTRDPYKIWVSEIILQQTRVIQGLPYYERFIGRFPCVRDLAQAPETEVLKLWQGLGYYSRARNLHAAARIILEKYHGLFPETYEEVRALPGIGDYTAAAIVSFAYNLSYPAIDGNVIRFISRTEGIFDPADSPACRRRILNLLEERIDPANPGIFNQGLMEFGALGCTPTDPVCKRNPALCPFSSDCYAFRHDIAESLPVKRKKEKLPEYELHYLLITDPDGGIWLHRRGYDDLWRGMFDLPSLPEAYRAGNDLFHTDTLAESPVGIRFLKQYAQTLSHRKLKIYFYRMESACAQAESILRMQENCLKVTKDRLPDYAVPKTIERFFKDFKII